MGHRGNILIVDDEPSIQTTLGEILTDEGFDVRNASDGQAALEFVRADPPDVVFLDIWLPGMDGIETLQAVRQLRSDVPVIIMSGHGSIDTAVQATKLGAFDYIEKPLSLDEVLVTVNNAFEQRKLERLEHDRQAVEPPEHLFQARTAKMRLVRRRINAEARLRSPVLIIGEVGVGKEFAARLIHEQSDFAGGTFYKVLCATLPDEVGVEDLWAASQAYADDEAPADVKSAFAGGTLFLDDIDQLTSAVQQHLADILQSVSNSRSPAFRLIGASANGRGLADHESAPLSRLFLGEACQIPPLRDCRQEIPALVQGFIEYFAKITGRPTKDLDDEALAALVNYTWPGNVKELRTTIERMVLTARTSRLHLSDVPIPIRSASFRPTVGFDGFQSLNDARRAWEREFISYHLRKNNWKIDATAKHLRVGASTLERKVKSYGLRAASSASNLNEQRQRTLKRSVVLCGQGLHSGLKTGLILSPLPPNSGIHFGTISSAQQVPAHLSFVESTAYATCLRNGAVVARTVEHLMAVLHMYRITNLLVKLNDEVPIMDGSAKDLCQLIEDGGIEEQDELSEDLIITDRYVVGKDQPGHRHIAVEPAATFSVRYTIDYPVPIGRQTHEFVYSGPQSFRQEIAPARTFGFVKDFEALESQGVAGGGRLDNLILVDDGKILNTELRYPDEFVRHKILDIIGDFYLLGRPLRGKIVAEMTGHTENAALLQKIKGS